MDNYIQYLLDKISGEKIITNNDRNIEINIKQDDDVSIQLKNISDAFKYCNEILVHIKGYTVEYTIDKIKISY